MASPETLRRWEVTARHLTLALSQLSASHSNQLVQETLELSREFIEHNELGLALEQLYEAGEIATVPANFWKELRLAAENMNLTEWIAKIDQHFVQP